MDFSKHGKIHESLPGMENQCFCSHYLWSSRESVIENIIWTYLKHIHPGGPTILTSRASYWKYVEQNTEQLKLNRGETNKIHSYFTLWLFCSTFEDQGLCYWFHHIFGIRSEQHLAPCDVASTPLLPKALLRPKGPRQSRKGPESIAMGWTTPAAPRALSSQQGHNLVAKQRFGQWELNIRQKRELVKDNIWISILHDAVFQNDLLKKHAFAVFSDEKQAHFLLDGSGLP